MFKKPVLKKRKDVKELIIKGVARVDDMSFTDIEGGFGAGKKAMLAKDIADIHGRETRVINQAIDMNRQRFKNGIDVVNIKDTSFVINLIDNKILSQNSVNRASNIYILSERGYAKLLKILEDDVAWEQYEKLVDGYFNMRAKQALPTYPELLRQHADLIEETEKLKKVAVKYEGQTDTIELYTVGDISKEYGISAVQLNRFLHDCRVQYRPNGSDTWQLYTEYAKDNLAKTKLVGLNDGRTVPMLLWTAKGCDFISDLIDQKAPTWYVG